MRYIIAALILFLSSTCIFAQPEIGDFKARQISMYEFQSKLFLELEKMLLDTIVTNFGCDSIDLANLSIEFAEGCFQFRLSPISGQVFSMFNEKDFDDSQEYGFNLKGSKVVYLTNKDDIDYLKEIGHLKEMDSLPFLSFVKNLNNKCLKGGHKNYSEINLMMDVSYCFEMGINVISMSYYFHEKGKH